MQEDTNSYLNFETIKFNGNNVRNITTLGILPDIPAKYLENRHLLEKLVEDDRLMESLSFELYGTPKHWDLLMVVNNMQSLFDLPVNHDIILNRVEKKLIDWKNRGRNLTVRITDKMILNKYKEMLIEEEEKNNRFRKIKYINPGSLSGLASDLEALKNEDKINKKLII